MCTRPICFVSNLGAGLSNGTGPIFPWQINATLALSPSEQTIRFETRKLGLQEILPNLGLGAARECREGSGSHAEIRRRNHVGIYRGRFDYLLVAWAFCVSRYQWFNPPCSRNRNHSPRFAFPVREKGQRLRGAYFIPYARGVVVCSSPDQILS
jgi:hypothetical protein